jgi:putative SOS response-associated peptidase YedK
MCGRYGLALTSEQLAEVLELDVSNVPEIRPRYNIAPTQPAPVVGVGREAPRGVSLLRWGLIPWWAKDRRIGARLINARSETADDKPAFRDAFAERRCLVPADGFYEWQKLAAAAGAKPRKQPWHIQLADGDPFAFAGLWERWRDPETADKVFTFTILTTQPNALVRPMHGRMPVILPRETWDAWLDPATPATELRGLLVPLPAERMTAWPVATLVNYVGNDAPELREPSEE